MPVDANNRYDIMINGVGYMLDPAGDGRIQQADLAPATARSAQGEGRYDRFQTESYHAQVQFSGGVGQQRMEAADQLLTAIGDGRSGGQFFPARKKLDEADGGTTSYYFEQSGDLYGMTATAIEEIGTANSETRTAGTVLQQPIESGNENVFWVQDNSGTKKLYRWDGSSAAEDITPTGYDPLHIARYGRNLVLFAEREVPVDVDLVDNVHAANGAGTVWTANWTTSTPPGATLIMVVATYLAANEPVPADPAWGSPVHEDSDTSASVYTYVISNAESRTGTELVQFDLAEYGWIHLFAVDGLSDQVGIEDIQDANFVSATSDTRTFVNESTGSFRLGILSRREPEAVTHNAGWTELLDQTHPTFTDGQGVVVWSTTAGSWTWTGTTTDNGGRTTLYSFQPTSNTVSFKRFYVLATEDDGQTWTPAPANFSSYGFGDIRATQAADASLWITTDRGLYQMRLDEQETVAGNRILNVAINGPVDTWQLPPDDNLGKWLCVFEKALYYPVGATIRRYVPGGLGQQVFPSSRWSTLAGPIQAMISGEGGVYFGMSGYLWCYDGRGFHCLATEPASNAFDYLYWHEGKLYCKADPADYFDFIYPSTRPDITDLTSDRVTTGYMVTSSLDFEKVSELKVIRTFQTQARFTNTTNTGSITLDYYNGCTTGADPGRIGGGATSLSWTNVGTHAYSDGYIQNYTLATPLKCYRLHLRATLTPGTAGYPILEGVVVDGRSIMPRTRRWVIPIALGTDVVDRQGNRLYDTPADVNAAYDALQAVRVLQSEFNLIHDDGSASGETVKVTAFNLQDSRQFGNDISSLGFTLTMVVDELPS